MQVSLKWNQSPEQLARKNLLRIGRLAKAQDQAVRAAGKVAVATADTRSWSRAKISKQDSPSRRDQNARKNPTSFAVRTEGEAGSVATVKVRSYWSAARTLKGAIIDSLFLLFFKIGKGDAFFRKGLVVQGKYKPFARNPRLLIWAKRPEKGLQATRHKVRVNDERILRELILRPAVAEARKKVLPLWADLSRKALK